MHRLLVLLALHLACVDGDTQPPTAPVLASVAPAPASARVDLNLPAIAPFVTPVNAPVDPPIPTRHRLPDGRELTHDAHRDRIFVGAADLGEVVLLPVPGLGSLIVPKDPDDHPRYYDIDPAAPRLRLLWDPPAGAHPILAGRDRGAPLFLIRRDGATDVDLVRVPAPGVAEARTVALDAAYLPASSDAVRDGRLLLVGATPRARTAVQPFREPVVLLDLATDRPRRLGDAHGDWSLATSVPHAYVAVQWADHDSSGRDGWFPRPCVNRVDPASERLTACTPAAP